MKTKDLIALAFLGVILVVIGIVVVTQFGNVGTKTAEVEVVRPIDPEFSSEGRTILRGEHEQYPIETVPAPDITDTASLGNNSPFGSED